MKIEQFIEVDKALSATIRNINVEDTEWVNEGGEFHLRQRAGADTSAVNIGRLSERATGNLSKFTKASPALLGGQADTTLNALVRTQLLGFKTISVLMDPAESGVVAALFPAEKGYVSYADMLTGLEKKVFGEVRGDPVNCDHVNFLLQASEAKICGEDWILGTRVDLCPNGVTKSRFQHGGWRMICTNGLVGEKYCDPLQGVDNVVINSILHEYNGRGEEFRLSLENTVQFARDTKLDRAVHLEVLGGIPLPLMEKHERILEESAIYVKELEDAGVSGRPETIFDSYNIFTSLCKTVENPLSRTKIEGAAFGWMAKLYNLFGKN